MMNKWPVSGILITMLSCASVLALDWPCWRGPHGTGISNETDWDPQALHGAPKIVWEANVGVGYSSVAIQADRLFTMGHKTTEPEAHASHMDIVFCLDPHTGREIWRYPYPCADGSWPGTRATPTIDGDRVYTLSRQGHLFCFDAATGRVVWKRNIIADDLAAHHAHGLACSPVVFGVKRCRGRSP